MMRFNGFPSAPKKKGSMIRRVEFKLPDGLLCRLDQYIETHKSASERKNRSHVVALALEDFLNAAG